MTRPTIREKIMRFFKQQPPLPCAPAPETVEMSSTVADLCKQIEEHVHRKRGERTSETKPSETVHPSA